MKKATILSIFILALALPLIAAEQTWQNVSLVDSHCYSKVKANPDSHTRECLMQCAKNGIGIIDADGKYLKLDKAGNTQAMELLKKSEKKDSVRADITGELKGGTISVKTISLK